MTRKMLTATMLVAALLLTTLSLSTTGADAQSFDPDVPDTKAQVCDFRFDGICVYGGRPTCPYNAAIVAGFCADALPYPGPFTNMPHTAPGPYGWGTLHPIAGAGADAAAPTAGGGTGGGLAHTGSESTVLAYAGAGLIAFGAVALGSRRKFFQGALED